MDHLRLLRGRPRQRQPRPQRHGPQHALPRRPGRQALAHPPHALHHQQVHLRLPGIRQHLRNPPLQGGQPRALHGRHLPLPLRGHVRRHWPRAVPLLRWPLPALERGQERQGQARRIDGGVARGTVHDHHDGILRSLRRTRLQRLLLPRAQPLWIPLVLRIRQPRGGGRRGDDGAIRRWRIRVPLRAGSHVARRPKRAPLLQLLQDEALGHLRHLPDVLGHDAQGHQRRVLWQAPRFPLRVFAHGGVCVLPLRLHGRAHLYEVDH
mmetsp:Transcript_12256/g.29958  ORF Transcript_12256/g.29958 Transcript_12256/m.29958 type:complete len:265 (-) Transcript_12256:873-1667(-)